jgi:hypothetical protein
MTELEKQQAETITAQVAQIQVLEEQVHLFKEQIEFMKKQLFGRSSEKTHIGQGQLSIFDENSPFFKHQRQLRTKPSKKR